MTLFPLPVRHFVSRSRKQRFPVVGPVERSLLIFPHVNPCEDIPLSFLVTRVRRRIHLRSAAVDFGSGSGSITCFLGGGFPSLVVSPPRGRPRFFGDGFCYCLPEASLRLKAARKVVGIVVASYTSGGSSFPSINPSDGTNKTATGPAQIRTA